MGDSLLTYNIFGDHETRSSMKNVSRQPLHNIENMGKTVYSGPLKASVPLKPNEPVKKGEVKKSFLSNAGKALQLPGLQNTTPARKAFTPRAVNVGSMIYNDSDPDDKGFSMEVMKFTKPTYKYDNYHTDMLDYLPVPEPRVTLDPSPPNTPQPPRKTFSMEFDAYQYQDEFFTDDFSNESILDEDLGLPDLY